MITFWVKVKGSIYRKKTTVAFFGQLLEQLGLLFISTSGHTGPEAHSEENFRDL